MKNKGFTLVEIIAVIVIMGILLLIVVPATSNLMRSNEEREYVTYYEMVEAGLEKYARTRRNEVGGTQDVGCIDDKNLADMIRLGYIKKFDQEDDVFCGTPREFDQALLSGWGVDTSKTYASMRVEGDHGKITTKLSLICVKMNEDGTYYEEPEYVKLIEVGPDCKTTEMYDPMEKFNILYNYDGGTAPSSGVPAFYYYGKGETVNGVPTKASYTFNGWNNGTSTKLEHIIPPGESGEKTFTAKWCNNCAPTNGATCILDATSTPGTCRYTTSCPNGYTISNNGKYNPNCTVSIVTLTCPNSPSVKTYNGNIINSGIICPTGSTPGGTTSAKNAGTYTQTCIADATHQFTSNCSVSWTINKKSCDLAVEAGIGSGISLSNYSELNVNNAFNLWFSSNNCPNFQVTASDNSVVSIGAITNSSNPNSKYSLITPKKIGNTNITVTSSNIDSNNFNSKSITFRGNVTSFEMMVTFNGNGGSTSQASKMVRFGEQYGGLPNANRANYSFTGWYTSPTGGTKIESNTIVTRTSNHVLYAHWEETICHTGCLRNPNGGVCTSTTCGNDDTGYYPGWVCQRPC